MAVQDKHAVAAHVPDSRILQSTGKSLNVLPDEVQHMQELYAAANRISDVNILCTCANLLAADLAWNNIEHIPQGLPPTLLSVNLSHNKLCDLKTSLSALASLPKLRSIHLKGNPFCLQPCYLLAVQRALPSLQHFDGKKVCWSQLPAAVQSNHAPASFAADIPAPVQPHTQQQLKICFNQLSVQKTVPARLPSPDAANEPVPPMYYYYLQLRTVDGSLVCSFPVLLTPQEELTQWQAQQAAEPAAAGKKAVKKTPAGKGGRADANTTNQRNAWYPEGSMSAVVPIQADVSSRDWLQSGMVVQLMQMRSPLSPTLATSQAQVADSSKPSLQQCLARGVLQADALLDGSVQQCSSNLDLMTELPLFNARGVRLGLEHLQDNVHKEASVEIQLTLLTEANT